MGAPDRKSSIPVFRQIIAKMSQILAKMATSGVVTSVEKKHPPGHGAGDNLSRHEKMPQIHLPGEFR
jgi:hypothetical protein